MNTQFTQADTIVNVEGNIQAIARVFGVMKSAVSYILTTSAIDTYTVLYDDSTQTCWARGTATGTPTTWSVSGNVLTLTTTSGTFSLVPPVYSSVYIPATLDTKVSVLQSGTGAVTRTQNSKNGDVVSILDFGADPTGVNDSAPAIQAAIDAMYARGGGAVYIPSAIGSTTVRGVYKVGSTITLRTNVNLYGDGYASTLQATSALSSVLLLQSTATTGIHGHFLRDFAILANGSTAGIACDQSSTDTAVKYLYGFAIENIHVESATTAYKFQGLWHSKLSNLTSSTCQIGIHLWGQCVSVHIDSSHLRRDSYTLANSFGIRIQPRVYAWSGDQTAGSRSEAIIIDGETMCIGQQYGIYVDDCLDLQLSNLDLDYMGTYGVAIINVNGGFSLRDSWIAADASGTSQFIGVVLPDSTTTQQQKYISGLHVNEANASTAANNIGISIAKVAPIIVRDCTFVSGWAGVSITGATGGVGVDNCVFGGNILYLSATSNNNISNCDIPTILDQSKPVGTFNKYTNNRGNSNTNGLSQVSLVAAATSGTATISNPSNLSYFVRKVEYDPSASADLLSISGNTVTVRRTTAVGVALGSYFEYFAV